MDSKYLVALFVLLSLFKNGHCLHCYSCNVLNSTIEEDDCPRKRSLIGCADGSVCFAASYEINSGIVKTYTTIQSCFPDMAGAECNTFFNAQNNLHTNAVFARKTCYSCTSDKCNKRPKPIIEGGQMIYIIQDNN